MKKLINYLVAILLWIVAIVLLVTGVTPWLFIGLAALHLLELLVIGYRTGRQNGISPTRTIIMCLLFGFTWWLPLRSLMKEDELKDADFIEDGSQPWREAF